MFNTKLKDSSKKCLIGLGVFLLYFLISYFQSIPFLLLNIDLEKVPLAIKTIYMILVELTLIFIISAIYRDYLKNAWNDLKTNHAKYFKEYFKYWLLALVLMMISNGIIAVLLPNASANNEEVINEMFRLIPFYTFVLAVFMAPILEELVFRQSFRYMFKNDLLFIIASGLMFGGFHVFGTFEQITDLLYIIPYSIPGIVFAYVLTKSKNIFVPMGLHFMHNGLLMSLQVFVALYLK